jgi:hypothetical protein
MLVLLVLFQNSRTQGPELLDLLLMVRSISSASAFFWVKSAYGKQKAVSLNGKRLFVGCSPDWTIIEPSNSLL